MKFKRMKMVSAACLAACMMTSAMPAALAADVLSPSAAQSIEPRMTYIAQADCLLSISSGTASVSGTVYGYYGQATKCTVTVVLQEKSGLFWNTIDTWTTTKNDYRASVSGSKSVTAGKTYRAQATVTVWAGSASESQTITTATKVA